MKKTDGLMKAKLRNNISSLRYFLGHKAVQTTHYSSRIKITELTITLNPISYCILRFNLLRGLRGPDPQNLSQDTPITIKFGTGNKSGNGSSRAKF